MRNFLLTKKQSAKLVFAVLVVLTLVISVVGATLAEERMEVIKSKEIWDGVFWARCKVYNTENDSSVFEALLNSDGVVISDYYASIDKEFQDGLVRVYKAKSYGYINTEGKLQIPYTWDLAEPFSDGMGRVGMYTGINDARFGFVDTAGTVVIEPQYQVFSGDFHDGYALVDNPKNGIPFDMVLIDKNNNVVFEFNNGWNEGIYWVGEGVYLFKYKSEKWLYDMRIKKWMQLGKEVAECTVVGEGTMLVRLAGNMLNSFRFINTRGGAIHDMDWYTVDGVYYSGSFSGAFLEEYIVVGYVDPNNTDALNDQEYVRWGTIAQQYIDYAIVNSRGELIVERGQYSASEIWAVHQSLEDSYVSWRKD